LKCFRSKKNNVCIGFIRYKQICLLIIFVFGALLSTSSCNKDECLDGNKYRVGSTRIVDPFTAIDVKLSAVVELIHDTNAPFIEFVVEGNLEQYIATPVSNNTLSISLDACFSEHENIVIKVHYDSLNTIIVSGPGDVKSNAIIVQDSLNLQIKSTGDILLTTDIQTINSSIEGTGDIFINGQINTHNIDINNSGSVNTYQAMIQDAVVNSTGSGNIYIRVKNSIKGTLANSGNLYYKRFPTINVVESSTGKVIDDN